MNDIIKEYEGLRLEAYVDPRTGGEPITIGYGTTVYMGAGLRRYGRQKVRLGDRLTVAEVEDELGEYLGVMRRAIRSEIPNVTLTLPQWEVLESFVYNLGLGGSKLQLGRLREGRFEEFGEKLVEYINRGSNVEAGLLRRRQHEQRIWVTELIKVRGSEVVNWLCIQDNDDGGGWLYGMVGDRYRDKRPFKGRVELMQMLGEYPSAGTIQVASSGWKADKVEGEVVPGFATLTRTGKKETRGCEELKLVIGDQSFICRSGQPWAQVFEPGSMNNVPGSMRPLPAGRWEIGPIEFAGGRDNYEKDWSEAIGPVWVGLEPLFKTRRSAIGIHIDGNAYGTAGCLGARTMTELKGIVAALRKFDPKFLNVVW